MANPYEVGGIMQGINQGLQISESIAGIGRRKRAEERQAKLDLQAEEDRARRIEQEAFTFGEQKKTAEELARTRERAQKLERPIDEELRLRQEQDEYQKNKQKLELSGLSAYRDAQKLQIQKAANELKTDKERNDFFKLLVPAAQFAKAPEDTQVALSKVYGIFSGQINPAEVTQKDLDLAGNVLVAGEMDRRIGNKYNAATIRRRPYKLPMDFPSSGEVTVVAVGNPKFSMDENGNFIVTTDQEIEYKVGNQVKRTVLTGAPATKNASAEDDDLVAVIPKQKMYERLLAVSGVGKATQELVKQGVPLEQVPIYIAAEGARLKADIPVETGLKSKKQVSQLDLAKAYKARSDVIDAQVNSGEITPAQAQEMRAQLESSMMSINAGGVQAPAVQRTQTPTTPSQEFDTSQFSIINYTPAPKQ